MPVIPATSEAKVGGSQTKGVTGLKTEFNVCLGNLVRLYLTIKIKTRAGDIGQLLSSCLGSPSGGMGPRPPHRLASKLLHFCFYSFALVQFSLEFYVLSSWPAEARALYSNLSHLSPSPQFRICCFLKSLPSLTHTLLTAGARQ